MSLVARLNNWIDMKEKNVVESEVVVGVKVISKEDF